MKEKNINVNNPNFTEEQNKLLNDLSEEVVSKFWNEMHEAVEKDNIEFQIAEYFRCYAAVLKLFDFTNELEPRFKLMTAIARPLMEDLFKELIALLINMMFKLKNEKEIEELKKMMGE